MKKTIVILCLLLFAISTQALYAQEKKRVMVDVDFSTENQTSRKHLKPRVITSDGTEAVIQLQDPGKKPVLLMKVTPRILPSANPKLIDLDISIETNTDHTNTREIYHVTTAENRPINIEIENPRNSEKTKMIITVSITE